MVLFESVGALLASLLVTIYLLSFLEIEYHGRSPPLLLLAVDALLYGVLVLFSLPDLPHFFVGTVFVWQNLVVNPLTDDY